MSRIVAMREQELADWFTHLREAFELLTNTGAAAPEDYPEKRMFYAGLALAERALRKGGTAMAVCGSGRSWTSPRANCPTPRGFPQPGDRFRGCPECPPDKGPDDIYNAGKLHVGACHAHKEAWTIGSNLFSGWKYETGGAAAGALPGDRGVRTGLD